MIFPDIESYIEYMAGFRDNSGTTSYWSVQQSISLASYDVSFVQSVAEQTLMKGIALSVKQATLAENLIKKYERQLKNFRVDQPNHRNYRHPLRDVVHIYNLSLEDNMLCFRFPFDNKLIAEIKDFANKEAQGRVFWNKDKKAWIFSLTEFNVNWVVSYAHAHHIPVTSEAQALLDLIIEAEKTPFKIELNVNAQNQFYIENAPSSLNDYITAHIGFDNLVKLVDNSGVLGYTVNPEIHSAMTSEFGPSFMKLCSARNIDFVPNKTDKHTISEIIEWAIAVDRLPICIYNPNFLIECKADYKKYFKDDEIALVDMHTSVTGQHTITFEPKIKLVYTNKVLSKWEGRMPLLVTYANLMHGSSKREFLDKADKVVYFCETLPRK